MVSYRMSSKIVYCLTFCLSFIFLSLEILLSILLSVLFFSPFFAVSFAFLGLSIAGVFVSLFYSQKSLADLSSKTFEYLCLLGGLLLLFTVVISSFHCVNTRLEFGGLNPLEKGDIYWNRLLIDSMASSLIVGLISTTVFFCLGVLYSLIYKLYSHETPRIYFFDLLGASMGCIFGAFSLNFFQLSSSLILLALLSFLISLVLARHEGKLRKMTAIFYMFICITILLFNIKTDFLEVRMKVADVSKTKGMDFRESWHQWNVYSRASLFIDRLPQNKHNIYAFSIVNGEGYIYPFMKEDPFYLKLFDYFQPTTLGFLLKNPQDILILMAGAGKDMIEAYSYSKGTADITGVELNPIVVNMAKEVEGYHLKDFFDKKNVHLIVQEGRSYVESIDKKFDAIILSYSGASASQYLGVSGATTQYLYTKEAFKSYFKHLKPGGTIGVAYGKKLKITAMARAALEELGYGQVANKVILMAPLQSIKDGVAQKKMFDGTDTLFLLIKNTDFTQGEVHSIEDHLSQMGWGSVYNPFYTHKDFKLFEDILRSKDLGSFLKDSSHRYNQDLSIPTDNAPFIDNGFIIKNVFNKGLWEKVLLGSWDDSTRQAVFNFSMLSFTVGLILIGLVFIIYPLMFNMKVVCGKDTSGFLVYFATIGLGFVFAEIAIIQSLTLLLGDPTYSFSVVLMSLLVSTAIGSLCSDNLFNRRYLSVKRVSIIACSILCFYFFFDPWLVQHCLSMNFYFKLMISLGLILPIGFFLGMFFPQGLKRLGVYDKNLIPWAWGFNGYMSIVGSAVSISLSRFAGFSSLLLIAAFLYLMIFLYGIADEFLKKLIPLEK